VERKKNPSNSIASVGKQPAVSQLRWKLQSVDSLLGLQHARRLLDGTRK
jgi:hypothetical protein